MSDNVYRPLTPDEIDLLRRNGCWTDDWDRVSVAKGFDARRVTGTVFRGDIRIGSLQGEIVPADGVPRYCGIFDAKLANVHLGDNVHIANVGGWLANLEISDDVLIEDVAAMSCTPDATFGNGSEIEVLNEGGGRELKLTALTSAQIAYLTVFYRHDEALIEALNKLADAYTEQIRSDTAFIGAHARIQHCGKITDVQVGPYASLNGVQSLVNGTLVSSKEAPVEVGTAVVAKDFIFQQGARITDGALLTGVLVGEATRVGRQFSGENCVLFANSEAFHSEAVAYFGGPYSVTHHRSTLLIATMTSFYNAGSGTNQSNHLYKLGPVHQGIMERGSKTGSFSYLLWPGRVGAFSVVMGKHYANFDTSELPFSYINEEQGKSWLIPAMNYFTVGTLRDGAKWPQRDRRSHKDVLDQITFDVLSPYTAQRMLKGRETMTTLYRETPKGQDHITYRGILIKRLLLKTCSRYYNMILDKFFGDALIARLEADPKADWKTALGGKAMDAGDWIDMAGLLCTRQRLETLLAEIKSGTITDQSALLASLRDLHEAYADDSWSWILAQFETAYGVPFEKLDTESLTGFLDRWKSASTKLINMVRGDSEKEFDDVTRTGFGIDGARDADFTAVRGSLETNGFVNSLAEQLTEIETRYAAAIKRIA